jgi:hypothetical protein
MAIKRGGMLFLLGVGLAGQGGAQTPGSAATQPARAIYVEDFEAHTGDAGAGGASRTGPVSRLRGVQAGERARKSAGSLSGAVADQFKASGYPAQRLPRGAPLPKEGWLVSGIFYEVDAKTGRIQMPSFVTGEPAPANTQVTVTVADLAVSPAAPFIVFGTAEALRGQGPPVGWNPYVVAAKFVASRLESSADIRKLAAEIVETILKNEATIEAKAPPKAN